MALILAPGTRALEASRTVPESSAVCARSGPAIRRAEISFKRTSLLVATRIYCIIAGIWGRSGRQAAENDRLPHDIHTPTLKTSPPLCPLAALTEPPLVPPMYFTTHRPSPAIHDSPTTHPR